MQPLSRRRALELVAAGGFTAVAGCLGGPPDCEPRVPFRLEPVGDDDIAAAADRPVRDLQPLARDLVRSARASGTATYHSAPVRPAWLEPFPISPPGDPVHRYVRLDGSYHRIVVDAAREGETTVARLVVRAGGDVNEAARTGEAIAFDDLPTHDRRSLLGMLGERATGEPEDEWGRVWTLGYLRDDHVASSRLVPRPDQRFVRYLGWHLSVERNGSNRETRVTYDVSLEHVADGAEGLAASVKRTDGVDIDAADLSAEQRLVVDEAAGGRRWVCLADAPDREGADVRWVDRDGGDGVDRSTVADLFETIGHARYVRYDPRWYAVDFPRWFDAAADD